MYDPSSSSGPSTPLAESSPPLWSGHGMQYYPGAVTWYRGSYWRCEAPHLSDLSGAVRDLTLPFHIGAMLRLRPASLCMTTLYRIFATILRAQGGVAER
jgi:hypothetical protein